MAVTTVPLTADRVYKVAFKSLAEQRGESMADMVRHALDATYGSDLEPHLIFFAGRVTQITQSGDKSDISLEYAEEEEIVKTGSK